MQIATQSAGRGPDQLNLYLLPTRVQRACLTVHDLSLLQSNPSGVVYARHEPNRLLNGHQTSCEFALADLTGLILQTVRLRPFGLRPLLPQKNQITLSPSLSAQI
jgi:hypothetical protein